MLLQTASLLHDTYPQFKENSITHRRFKHAHLKQLLDKLPFEKKTAGHSFENREIFKITIGQGSRQVLLWSQMHGDEATATMAMLDIFNFFKSQEPAVQYIINEITQHLTLHFVPMLNPDGAERFIRRNAQGIDINRDALALQTPEGQLLKSLQQQLKPEFAFNLHDKRTRYSAGKNPRQATLSFLATAYDEAKSWNPTRWKAMQTIGLMNEVVQQYIPQYVGRWSDEFEPRAFGDNIQKWGSSLILIESGGYKHDREKQYIRQLNFVAILAALYGIASHMYELYELDEYEAIPMNDLHLYDLLIRNATFEQGGQYFQKDIGIIVEEETNADATSFALKSTVEDMGDLGHFWGIEELDATGLVVQSFDDFPEAKNHFKIADTAIGLEKPANFVLVKQTKPAFYIVNGTITQWPR